MNNSVSVPSRTAGGDPAAFSKPPVRARIEKAIRNLLNVLVLLGSVLVIAALSFEVFHDSQQLYYKSYMKIQFWVCIVFLIDFF